MMRWDVKHDRAKRIINAFLDNAAYWQEREDLAEGLTEEELEQVNQEMELMIASIRKRYKLEVRLPQQDAQIQKKDDKVEIPTKEEEKTVLEPINQEKDVEKPKRGRKASSGEKKTTRKPREKKVEAE